jgi:uncharacterized phage protein gp47/JayE
MTTLEEATTTRTAEEVRDDLLDALVALGVQATGWDPMAVQRAIIEIDAEARATEEGYRALIAQAGFLRTAPNAGDAWLDLLSVGFFGIERAPATSAVQRIRLTNAASSGPWQIEAGKFIVSTPNGDETGLGRFVNEGQSGTLLAGVGQFVDVDFMAALAGSGGNAPVTALAGVSVTNTSIVTPGRDAESNESLIKRCLGRWASISFGGALEAYQTWVGEAFTSAGETNPITRVYVDDTNPNGIGSTDIYLATESGPATTDQVDTVDDFLQPRRALGTGELRVFQAIANPQTVSVTVYAKADVAAEVEAALLEMEADTAMGGTLYLAEIVQRVMDVDQVYNMGVVSPLADVALGPGEVIEVTPVVAVVVA